MCIRSSPVTCIIITLYFFTLQVCSCSDLCLLLFWHRISLGLFWLWIMSLPCYFWVLIVGKCYTWVLIVGNIVVHSRHICVVSLSRCDCGRFATQAFLNSIDNYFGLDKNSIQMDNFGPRTHRHTDTLLIFIPIDLLTHHRRLLLVTHSFTNANWKRSSFMMIYVKLVRENSYIVEPWIKCISLIESKELELAHSTLAATSLNSEVRHSLPLSPSACSTNVDACFPWSYQKILLK